MANQSFPHQTGPLEDSNNTESTSDIPDHQKQPRLQGDISEQQIMQLVQLKPNSTYERTPETLLSWMTRLYARVADERTLVGEMGLWPFELAPYIIALCRCYSDPQYGSPPELMFTPGLLSWEEQRQKPVRPSTCLVLFSGGKDSLASGIRAEGAGYKVIAVTVARINHGYPYEAENAQEMARLMGWEHHLLEPTYLPHVYAQSVIKNQYALALAFDTLDFVPEIWTAGNYLIEDCNTTGWFSDFETAMANYQVAIATMRMPLTSGSLHQRFPNVPEFVASNSEQTFLHQWDGFPKRLRPVMDPLESLKIWLQAPAEVQKLTTSCMMTPRFKEQTHRLNLAAGVPLAPYECGGCAKCLLKAVLLTDQFAWPTIDDNPVDAEQSLQSTPMREAIAEDIPGMEPDFTLSDLALTSNKQRPPASLPPIRQPYPSRYIARARKKLAQAFEDPVPCFAHPSLQSPVLPPGESVRHLWNVTYGGLLAPIPPDFVNNLPKPAREPIVRYLIS